MDRSAPVSTKPRSGGRPRSERTRRTILLAALELLKQESVQSISIEAIARSAGVSKATIYRWWNSKASVIIDAFMEHHIVRTPMPHDVPCDEALVRHWRLMAEQYSGWPGRIVAQILAEGQSDPAVLREFRERFHSGRRAVTRDVADALMGECGLAGRTSAELLMDMYYGPIYLRLLWGHAQIDEEFIEDFPVRFFRWIGIEIDSDGRRQRSA